MLIAGASFAVIDTTTKYVSAVVPVFMALWVRYILQAVFSSAVLVPMHGRAIVRTTQPRLQVVRGLLLLFNIVISFYSLQRIPVGEFAAIVMVTPLAVTVLAVTVLKEKVGALHWLFLVGGFIGVLAIVRPGSGAIGWAALFPLTCMASNSVFQLLTSRLGKSESPATTHFYSAWVGVAALSLALPFTWTMVDSVFVWSMMCLVGVAGAIGHFALAMAYQRAATATLMPYLYSHVGFSVLGGWIVFAHVPDHWAMVGICLIAACGVGAAWLTARENSHSSQMPES